MLCVTLQKGLNQAAKPNYAKEKVAYFWQEMYRADCCYIWFCSETSNI